MVAPGANRPSAVNQLARSSSNAVNPGCATPIIVNGRYTSGLIP
jgi:hypothetical protein